MWNYFHEFDEKTNQKRLKYIAQLLHYRAVMFLSSPTTAELQMLDLPILLRMLTQQTADYIKLVNEEGFTARTNAAKELLDKIQEAIQMKRFLNDGLSNEKAAIVPGEGIRIPGARIQKTN